MLHKVLLKVICDDRLEWRYFCSVPQGIFHDFVTSVKIEDLDINAYLSMWAKHDWGVSFSMGIVEDIERLKTLIKASSKRVYPELYIFQSYDLIPDEDFWVKLWVSSHMRNEAERTRAE